LQNYKRKQKYHNVGTIPNSAKKKIVKTVNFNLTPSSSMEYALITIARIIMHKIMKKIPQYLNSS